MSNLDLDAIEARADAATAGPWDVVPEVGNGSCEVFVPNGTMNTETVLSFADHLDCEECGRPANADIEFIAAARTDIPVLLAEVRRLRALVPAETGDQR